MAASDKKFCTMCHNDGTSNDAVRLCTECEVFLCKECEKHHKTKHFYNFPESMQKDGSQCKDHKKIFEIYCSFHACPCCVDCVADKHLKCEDMRPLSDVVKQFKSSASVYLLERDLKDLQENLKEIIKYIHSRIDTSNIQKTKAILEMQAMRQSINDYLSRLEKEVLDDLESKHLKMKSEMNTLLEEMEKEANQISELQNQFTKMKQHATELQMYFGLREIEKITSEVAKYIDHKESTGHFSDNVIEISLLPIQSILQDVKSFGYVHILTRSSSLQVNAGRKDQAQYLVAKVPRIKQIKPSFLRKLTITQRERNLSVYACRILPDGKFLILDNNGNHLLLFSNEGEFIREVVELTGYPQDACFVRHDTVAVTLGSTNQTALVDVEKNEIIETIELSHGCKGIASDGKILVISSKEKSTIVNLSDKSHTIVEGLRGIRISLFKENIYGTSNSKNKVCCYTKNGVLLWTFQHQDINYPAGITTDINGFVYVVSNGNNNIVVVSPDGITSNTILSKADEITFPIGIDIDKEAGMMMVSSEIYDESDGESYQTCFVYKIKIVNSRSDTLAE